MKFIIRDFNEADMLQIANITQESFTSPWSIKSFLAEYENPQSIFKVAEIDNEIIGYILVKVILDEAEILSLAIKTSFRRKGIASALLKDVILKLKDIVKICYLEVRISNTEAINLYKKLGFKEYGIRKDYYIAPQEDALLMKIDLQ